MLILCKVKESSRVSLGLFGIAKVVKVVTELFLDIGKLLRSVFSHMRI